MDGIVLLLVHLDAEEFEAFHGTGTGARLVLAHTGGPHHDVHTAHGSSVCTDVFLDAVSIHLHGEGCALVAFLFGSIHFTHIGRDA